MDDDFLGELVSSGDEELSDGFMDELLGSDDSAGEGGVEGVSVNGLSNESSKVIPTNNSSIISANTSEETPYSQSLSQLANHRRSLSRHSLQ